MIFALKANFGHGHVPGKASIKAITWTNADDSASQINLTQKQP